MGKQVGKGRFRPGIPIADDDYVDGGKTIADDDDGGARCVR